MKLAGKTGVGRVRQDNQDDYRAGELPGDAAWALVCDGMGGARRRAGSLARCACSVIERCFQEQYNQCIPGEEETFLKKATAQCQPLCVPEGTAGGVSGRYGHHRRLRSGARRQGLS